MHLRLMKTGKSHWFAFALWFPFRSTITATDKPHSDPQVGWPADTVLSTVGTTPQPPDLLTLTPAFSPFYFSLHPPIDFHQWHISKQLFLYTSQTFYFLQLGFFPRDSLTGARGSAFPALLPCCLSDSPPPSFWPQKAELEKDPSASEYSSSLLTSLLTLLSLYWQLFWLTAIPGTSLIPCTCLKD